MFPSIIDTMALDPGEDVFYAGGRDGKIYIAALNAVADPNNNYGLHILGVLSEQRLVISVICYIDSCVLLLMRTFGFVNPKIISFFVLYLRCSGKLPYDILCLSVPLYGYFCPVEYMKSPYDLD